MGKHGVYLLRGSKLAGKSAEVQRDDADHSAGCLHTLTLIGLTLIPLAMFAAALMFAIAIFRRGVTKKKGQSYLVTPLVFVVIFPALMGGVSGLEMTPVFCFDSDF